MVRALLVLAISLLVALSGNARAGQVKPSAAPPEATTQTDDMRVVFKLLFTGQHEQAVRAADEFFTRYPLGSETFGVLLAKAESQYQLGRVDDAIRSYEKTLPFVEQLNNVAQRRFVLVFFRLGMLYRRKAQYDTAIRFVEAGLTRNPQSAYYQILRGELLRERGDRDGALKHFTTVLGSPTPTPEERVVLRIKMARLGATPPGAPALNLAAQPLHSGVSFGIVPINSSNASVSVPDLCLLLESKWRVPCTPLPAVQVDEARILDQERQQYAAEQILQELARRYPPNRQRHSVIIGVTERDIFGPDTNFVFSWQAPQAGLGVLSTHRFVAGLDDFYEPSIIGTRRVGLQLLSTSGSLLGFARPTQPDCPLAYPNDFHEFLLKSTKLCESEIEQRDILLKTKGVPSHPFGEQKNDEISRLYQKYYFD
jgi:predicted Zn-dependent protease/predicted negative regulator of RcsB-dependent stress response